MTTITATRDSKICCKLVPELVCGGLVSYLSILNSTANYCRAISCTSTRDSRDSFSNGNTLRQCANHGHCSWRSASIDTGLNIFSFTYLALLVEIFNSLFIQWTTKKRTRTFMHTSRGLSYLILSGTIKNALA